MSSESLVYRTVLGYELTMRALYGRHYSERYATLAALVPSGARVVDLCCGPGGLFDAVAGRGIDYLGVDVNPRFLDRLSARGARTERRDLRDRAPLPRGDVVVMQASLYHFLPDAERMVARMLEAARERVIVSEPVRNLASGRVPALSHLARRHADPGTGQAGQRFSSESLRACMERFETRIEQRFALPGGREHVYVLRAGDG